MAVAFINPEVKRVNDRSATAPAPETPAKETARMEFPYDDLDLMYNYITKELGIQDPFNK
jgi:hypothetical protein